MGRLAGTFADPEAFLHASSFEYPMPTAYEIPFEDFALVPQYQSEIRFPGITLRFNNDFECFIQEVLEHFPAQKDNFLRLVRCIQEYDELDLEAKPMPGRQIVSSFLTDPLLIDMLFCPLMIYGNAAERGR